MITVNDPCECAGLHCEPEPERHRD